MKISRNSKNIYDQFSNLYKGDDGTEFVSKGPEGPEVRINSYNSQKDKQDDIVFQIKRQIKRFWLFTKAYRYSKFKQ